MALFMMFIVKTSVHSIATDLLVKAIDKDFSGSLGMYSLLHISFNSLVNISFPNSPVKKSVEIYILTGNLHIDCLTFN